jgi:uncharacterized repeat protein (TIGR04076 family)
MSDTTGRPLPEAAGCPASSASSAGDDMALYDIDVVVDRIEGRSVCGMRVGDRFRVTESSRLSTTSGHFCLYALQAVLPMIPAKQRPLPAGDWLEKDAEAACPDPEERLIMRIERGELRGMRSEDLT